MFRQNSSVDEVRRFLNHFQRWNRPPLYDVDDTKLRLVLEEKAVIIGDEFFLRFSIADNFKHGFEGEFYTVKNIVPISLATMFVRRSLDKNIIKRIHDR
ncbi:hypothetical protein HPB48_008071 [Haemaphysalis longicornis]|uniref:Uncharacterized protein n=1 Tax=Haemaphysalis longicornis TaxID=44386 RepID=A0A9J6FZA1_HAELO|nr:hypothetical protein HPB48_008071 [Haemaphysalis longicornis]